MKIFKDSEWFDKYNKWHNNALEEAKEKYPECSYGHVEVCEDGSIYLGNLCWLPKNSVTPWRENDN